MRYLIVFMMLFVTTAVLADDYALGVPYPEFGLDERPPAHPPAWPGGAAESFYYIDNVHPQATDLLNPYGYPDKPRATIPTGTLDAGSYLEINGGPYELSKDLRIKALGTADSPVWIRGGDADNRPVIRAPIRLRGKYTVVENLAFDRSRKTISVGYGSEHVAVRNNLLQGPGRNDGNTAAISFSGRKDSPTRNIVFSGNEIHGFGDTTVGAEENDYHGFKGIAWCYGIWVVDNHVYDMGGDSIQIGEARLPDEARCKNVYIARNDFHSTKENAVDIKNAQDIIVSQNDMYDFWYPASHDGLAVVVHDGADNVWFLSNSVHDASSGMFNTRGTAVWFIGNEIYDIRGGDSVDPANHYGAGVAMHFRGKSSGGAINNTVTRYDKGLQLSGGSPYEVVGNVFAGRASPNMYDLMIASGRIFNALTIDFNLYESFAARQGNRDVARPAERHWIGEAPQFIDAARNDFRLAPASPAIGVGAEATAYAAFEQRYGIDIRRDSGGIERPQGKAWDLGAREHSDAE